MRDLVLNIGGKLETGDVVGVAHNNCVQFGWFVEPGQYGSLKYISFQCVENVNKQYQDYTNGIAINSNMAKKFAKGLTYKSFYKDFITSFGPVNNRAFKISNPEEFFKGAGDTEILYTSGKQVLNSIKFPAK